MRFATVFTLGIAVVSTCASLRVARQTIPPCYAACEAEADKGDCSATDIKCLCTNPTFLSETEACVVDTCDSADLVEAEEIGEAACLNVGVTLSGPTPTSVTLPPSVPAAATPTSVTSSLPSSVPEAAAPTSDLAALTSLTLPSSIPAATPTSDSAPSTVSGSAAVRVANLNSFIGLAAVGLVALAIN